MLDSSALLRYALLPAMPPLLITLPYAAFSPPCRHTP